MGMMEQCIEGMNSMMGSGTMGVVLFMVALLLLVWVLGLATLGALGVWGIKKLARR